MKVWVIASNIGLNGIWVHGVRSTEPTQAEMDKFAREGHRNPDGSRHGYQVASTTGYSHTEAWEMEVDGEWE